MYRTNKSNAITLNRIRKGPRAGDVAASETDQTAAKDTDRNIIVKRFLTHGQLPQGRKPGMYGDFSILPEDLQGFLAQAKSLQKHRQNLPKELRGMTTEELLALTPDELKDILTPPDKRANNKDEEREDIRDKRPNARLLPEADTGDDGDGDNRRSRGRDQQPKPRRQQEP